MKLVWQTQGTPPFYRINRRHARGARSARPRARARPTASGAPPTRRPTRVFAWLVRHPALSFLAMATSFTLFGALSLNLAQYLLANADYLLTYGWLAVMEGGLMQFVELWTQVFVATAAFVVFKLCEVALVERISHRRAPPD